MATTFKESAGTSYPKLNKDKLTFIAVGHIRLVTSKQNASVTQSGQSNRPISDKSWVQIPPLARGDRMGFKSQKREWKSKVIECACGFGHTFLHILPDTVYEEHGDEPQWWIGFVHAPINIRDRIEHAWGILFHNRYPGWDGINIDAEDLRDMRQWIDETLSR